MLVYVVLLHSTDIAKVIAVTENNMKSLIAAFEFAKQNEIYYYYEIVAIELGTRGKSQVVFDRGEMIKKFLVAYSNSEIKKLLEKAGEALLPLP